MVLYKNALLKVATLTTTKNAKTKKIFFDGFNQFMQAGNRVQVNYDNGAVEVYNICPVNEWRNHSEVLLVPVENE